MLKDKMILNEDEIKAMLDKDEDAYKNKVEKSFCRMFIYGDGIRGENDDWLKAYCLDQLKKYTKKRRDLGRAIRQLSILAGDDENSTLINAYNKWKRRVFGLIKFLNGQTQEYLFNRHHRNQMEIKAIAAELENA